MAAQTDVFELGRLSLHPGEGRRLDLEVRLDPLEFGAQRYEPRPPTVPVILDVARTMAGFSLRLRLEAGLAGPCARCLEEAGQEVRVDVREIDQPGGGEALRSPYVDDGALDLRAWARDALVLALPEQILCTEGCRGLCAICGENLNEAGQEHEHERPPDPRLAKLSELKLE